MVYGEYTEGWHFHNRAPFKYSSISRQKPPQPTPLPPPPPPPPPSFTTQINLSLAVWISPLERTTSTSRMPQNLSQSIDLKKSPRPPQLLHLLHVNTELWSSLSSKTHFAIFNHHATLKIQIPPVSPPPLAIF